MVSVLVASWVAVIVTLGTRAPVGSVTVPVTVASVVWAVTIEGRGKIDSKTADRTASFRLNMLRLRLQDQLMGMPSAPTIGFATEPVTDGLLKLRRVSTGTPELGARL